jgi:hypothetical protein
LTTATRIGTLCAAERRARRSLRWEKDAPTPWDVRSS